MTEQAHNAFHLPTADDSAVRSRTNGTHAADRPSESAPVGLGERPREIGGREGLEPTRYGDWEMRGRCIDF